LKKKITVTIIILAYNKPKTLYQTLKYAAEQEIEKDIIVIDNCSSENIKPVVDSFKNIKYIRLNSPAGFGKANNIGINLANGKYTLILNDDLFLKGRSLSKMVEYLDKNPKAGAIGPRLLNIDGKIQFQGRRGEQVPIVMFFYGLRLYKFFPKNKIIGHYPLSYIDEDKIQNVFTLSGSCMLVRTDLLKKLGGFDERFGFYSEDIDLFKKIHLKGYRVIYFPKISVTHLGGQSFRSIPFRSVIYLYSSYIKYGRKYFPNNFFYKLYYHIIAAFGFMINFSINILKWFITDCFHSPKQ
jgi:GT2 family glycosyltransferase